MSVARLWKKRTIIWNQSTWSRELLSIEPNQRIFQINESFPTLSNKISNLGIIQTLKRWKLLYEKLQLIRLVICMVTRTTFFYGSPTKARSKSVLESTSRLCYKMENVDNFSASDSWEVEWNFAKPKLFLKYGFGLKHSYSLNASRETLFCGFLVQIPR